MDTIATIEEIRIDRLSISKKCDFDSKKLIDYYIARQKKRSKQVHHTVSKNQSEYNQDSKS
ncbi:MAG: hypothetical protein PF692_03015 [Kiritimatiellae bacterium]|jgi:hypothetical protein|nr:hypothetical protein [Kiritimatiellia bacterium]